jgi:hypothetical protein
MVDVLLLKKWMTEVKNTNSKNGGCIPYVGGEN